MAKSFEAIGKELDEVDAQIAKANEYAQQLPSLTEKRAQLVSVLNRRAGGLPEDPADGDDDAPSLSQVEAEKGVEETIQGEVGKAQDEEIETVDADGLVPRSVAEDLDLASLRQDADGTLRVTGKAQPFKF